MTRRTTKTILDVLQDRRLLGGLPCFHDLSTWRNWVVFLKATYGLPMSRKEEQVFCQFTGRSHYRPPLGGFPEAVAIVGVQAGKSQMAIVPAVHAALTGQSGTHAVLIGQDHRGAMRVLLKYAREPFETLDPFRAEVVRSTADTVELQNGVSLSAYPCRPEAVRGLRASIVVIDELAFFITTEGRPTDQEMLRVARGRVATTHGKVIVLSSPYGQFGGLWNLYTKHYGKEDSSTLIWQASAPEMNPTLRPDYLQRMEQEDPEAYESEVLGRFRAGVSNLFDPVIIHERVDPEMYERLPVAGTAYVAAIDSASGSGKDKFTLAIAHLQDDVVVQDLVRAWSPPFNPSGVISEIADLAKQYQLHEVWGDRYAPGFVAEQFRSHGLTYRFLEQDRSALYLDLLPLVNAGKALFLKVPELLRELVGLVRRRGPSGRDRVDHTPGRHDDLANATAGALTVAARSLKAFLCSLCRDPDCPGIHIGGAREEDETLESQMVSRGAQKVDPDIAALLQGDRAASTTWRSLR